jgi:hypothetical protein
LEDEAVAFAPDDDRGTPVELKLAHVSVEDGEADRACDRPGYQPLP